MHFYLRDATLKGKLMSECATFPGSLQLFFTGNQQFSADAIVLICFGARRLFHKCFVTFVALHVAFGYLYGLMIITMGMSIHDNHDGDEHWHVIATFYRLCIPL